MKDINRTISLNDTLPTIYAITPTYKRWTQKADLTRLCFAFMHVPKLHWIVVEDSEEKTDLVRKLLSGNSSCKIAHTTHLNVKTSKQYRLGPKDPVWKKSRGAEQRNLGIEWLQIMSSKGLLGKNHEGVVYFADDDNTYDIELFEEVRMCKAMLVCIYVRTQSSPQ